MSTRGFHALELGRGIVTELGARAISGRHGQELGVSEKKICRQPDNCKGAEDSHYTPRLSLTSSSTHSKPSSISLPRLGRPVSGSQPITS